MIGIADTHSDAQDYSIEILLLPNMGQVIDLSQGGEECRWHPKTDERGVGNLEFYDAPYGLYEYLNNALGYDASDDNSAYQRFANAFFCALNQEIERQGGLSEGYFTFTLPKEYFSLAFHINVALAN
jgi:hypothetical protein